MTIYLSEKAEKELDKMDEALRKLFLKHLTKLERHPLQKHLKFGIPFNVEKVTKSARIIFGLENDNIIVLHCFATHKEYEKWYKAYK